MKSPDAKESGRIEEGGSDDCSVCQVCLSEGMLGSDPLVGEGANPNASLLKHTPCAKVAFSED